ncbi:ROK family transcriptional regulator [Stappia sp. TSB10GB4]|uniref:ROK family transcriptional regulator n=1 Tax=Stappia sp. TSB10GB4 TaxID=2003584 RepID=UPI0016470C03|nr:ROK family transcriptional regulator [Stappia sp. TSB10GB4]
MTIRPAEAEADQGRTVEVARRPLVGQGSNSVQLRRYNERIVLQVLRRVGEASKADLARLAQLTNAAIGGIIQDLTTSGLIETLGKRHDGGRGQPATMLRLSATGAYGFGVRIDRTSIETVLADFSGRIIGRQSHDRFLPEPERVVDIVARDIASLLRLVSPEEHARIAGVGVAMPFNLGSWLHELGLPRANFHLWDDIDFKQLLQDAIDFPVFSENDGTAAAIAELFSGAGRHADDFLYLFLGPAIGGGVVYGGDCVKGVRGNAGDVAMIPVPRSRLASAPAPRGEMDILLTRASLSALKRHLAHHGIVAETRDDLERAVESNHPAVEEWLADCVAALTPAIWSAISLIDVPLVVIDFDIDGGLPQRLIDELTRALALAAPQSRVPPRLQRGSFGQDAGAAGAANLPIFFNYSPRTAILTANEGKQGAADAAARKARKDIESAQDGRPA